MSSKNTNIKPSIHWIGAGLASGPGIVSLASKWGKITVWDMTLDRAVSLREHVENGAILNTLQLNLDDDTSLAGFLEALNPGDIIVSMLPTAFHVRIAKIALSRDCHMISSSYLTDDMIALNDQAVEKGLSVVNEVGLDPGIDHLFAHILVDKARKSGVLGKNNAIEFLSYCGGFPVEKTPFTYKFSWTPLGVLTALGNPSQIIEDGAEKTIKAAWEHVNEFTIEQEVFEVYPNRNSLPFIAEYGLGEETNITSFVRGTLRLSGWKEAWKDIFKTLESASSQKIKELSDQLWQKYQYQEGEEDRVVLYVSLSSTSPDGDIWQEQISLDVSGSNWKSAMAACVSLTVAEAVSAVMVNRLPSGVQAAPHDISEACTWLKNLQQKGIEIKSDSLDLS